MSDTESVRSAFVELWGAMGPFWGVPPATARVYGWLISKKEPATADEVVEDLGISRGAVSMACRELRDWGLVHDDRASGSRQSSYRPETDLEKAIRNIVLTRAYFNGDGGAIRFRQRGPDQIRALRDRDEPACFSQRLRCDVPAGAVAGGQEDQAGRVGIGLDADLVERLDAALAGHRHVEEEEVEFGVAHAGHLAR
jgi:predicted transcriptional regulator